MRKIYWCISILFFYSCNNHTSEKLIIATAANMQFAMHDLVKAFTEETGIACETVISSSGKLTAQIVQGAPYDVLVSADMKYPQTLVEQQKTIGTAKVYALGQLVLWTTREGLSLQRFPKLKNLLLSDTIRHLALANPKTAPYGKAAKSVLDYYSLTGTLEDKLVYGESIAQTNQFITTQAADLGFTAKSVVLTQGSKYAGHWIEIPNQIHPPIQQGVVLLKNAKSRLPQAQKFYNFLFSPKAKEILNNFGYQTKH